MGNKTAMDTSITLRELTERWLQESLGVFSQASLDHYRYLLETHVIAWFGDRVDITREELREFETAKLATGMAESVVFMEERLLQRVLDYGSGLGLCPATGWNLAFRTPQKKRVLFATRISCGSTRTVISSHIARKMSALRITGMTLS